MLLLESIKKKLIDNQLRLFPMVYKMRPKLNH